MGKKDQDGRKKGGITAGQAIGAVVERRVRALAEPGKGEAPDPALDEYADGVGDAATAIAEGLTE